jgi:hypothetical protein
MPNAKKPTTPKAAPPSSTIHIKNVRIILFTILDILFLDPATNEMLLQNIS